MDCQSPRWQDPNHLRTVQIDRGHREPPDPFFAQAKYDVQSVTNSFTTEKGIELFCALPDFCVWVANTNLGHGIALDLDGELPALPVLSHPRCVAVVLGLHVLVAIERVGPAEMFRDQSGIGIGVRQSPVPAGAKL